MASKRKVLLHLDTDPRPSVFDAIVAIDAGAEELLSHGAVKPDEVQGVVHGAIFTRGPADLPQTAIFIGGRDLAAGEAILNEVRRHLLPQFKLQVSVMLDSNGANTTAAAAVHAITKQVDASTATALVLGTGPVGQRIALLLANLGAKVRLGYAVSAQAEEARQRVLAHAPHAALELVDTSTLVSGARALQGCQVLVGAGPAGAQLMQRGWDTENSLKVAVDLNAVPPAGIDGIDLMAHAKMEGSVSCYGALAIGGMKMKIHKAALAQLFTRNDQVLDAPEIYAIAKNT